MSRVDLPSASKTAYPGIDSWSLALITAAALALRLVGLGAASLWHDEALEFWRAAGDWSTVVFGRAIDQDPPMMALFYHGWVGLGTAEWWLRVPSALVGAGAVYLAGGWAGRRFGRRVGLLAALFMAVAPVLVHYGQELNQYAAMVFLALAAWIAFEGVLSRGRKVDWWRFTGVSVVALGTHYGLVFPLAAMGLVLAWSARRGRGLAGAGQGRSGSPVRPGGPWTWIGLYAIACAATLAVLWALGLRERATVAHLQARFGGTHVVKELDYLADKLWREVAVFFTLPFSGGPALWIVGSLVVLALAGAVVLWRDGPAGRRLVGVAFAGALALVYPADGMGWYPLGFRWALFVAPAFVVALAAGVDWLWSEARELGMAVAAAVVLIGLLFAPQADHWNPWLAIPREEMRPMLQELARDARAGDVVYVSHGAEPAFRYYWDHQEGSDLASRDRSAVMWGRDIAVEGAAAEAARITEAVGDAGRARVGRLWLALARVEGDGEAALLADLARMGWQARETSDFQGVRLVRLERN